MNALLRKAILKFIRDGRTTEAKDQLRKTLGVNNFTGDNARAIKELSVDAGLMKPGDKVSQKTGMRVGDTQRDYKKKSFIEKQSKISKKLRQEGKGRNLDPVNQRRIAQALLKGDDPTVKKGGIEGIIKAAVKEPIRSDTGRTKGLLSLARAAILKNPKDKQKILSRQNLLDYDVQIQPQLNKLDDLARQIEYFRQKNISTTRSPAQHLSDYNKLENLMNQYIQLTARLRKKLDPNFDMTSYQRSMIPQKMTFGHESDLGLNIENARLGNVGSGFSDFLTTDVNRLTNYLPEIGPLNRAKLDLDTAIMQSMFQNPAGQPTSAGIREFSKLYDKAGIRSVLPSRTGKKMVLGTPDVYTQMDFMKKALDRNRLPFQGMNKKNLQELLYGQKLLSDFGYKKGGKVPAYMAGGIGKLGAKVIKNLVGKLSNKELKMILDTSFKSTNPNKSPAKIRQNKLLKKLGPDKYRYRNVKSEVYE